MPETMTAQEAYRREADAIERRLNELDASTDGLSGVPLAELVDAFGYLRCLAKLATGDLVLTGPFEPGQPALPAEEAYRRSAGIDLEDVRALRRFLELGTGWLTQTEAGSLGRLLDCIAPGVKA